MPPYVPRKRLRSASPSSSSTKKKKKPSQSKASSSKGAIAPPRKPTLFDDLDSVASPRRSGSRIHEIQDSDDDDSPLSSLSDIDFEDVPPANKRQKQSDDDDDEDEDEDIEFEDVDTTAPAVQQTLVPADIHGHISNDLELTLVRDTRISLTNDALLGRKGPTKRERQIRVSTHCVHVMLLMWHNALRNAWVCDPTVQGIMLSHLPPRLWDEVDRWRRGSGLELHPESGSNQPEQKSTSSKGRGKKATTPAATSNVKARKGKGKEKEQETQSRESRDWSSAAQRLENGAVDRSQGDPLYRLMKALSAWWKQRFRITAPGLRKRGYMSLERLDRITKAFNEAQKSSEGVNDNEKFGERIRSLDEFRICALECSGSRDVGEQLFTALLRGLGMEARMVASLQPLGFGWNKLEEADPEKEDSATRTWTTPIKDETTKSKTAVSTKTSASSSRGTSVHTGKGTTSRTETDSEPEVSNSDDEILIDGYSDAPSTPKKSKPYDKDLPYPHYWTEVLSPVQNKYIAVEPLQTSLIGTNPEITVQALEPRGAKAEKAKQAVSYILAYSPDGTAKDVTIRYLKGKVLPGRTKGNRLPPEKIPVYNKYGKIKRYDLRDWFKDRAMRGYSRGFSVKYPVTEADALEDETDLRPAEPTKREPKQGEETLQFYKSSKEFVLERHLKREEALLPAAKAVRYFNPKAKKKTNQEDTDTTTGNQKGKEMGEPVYLRKDVVVVKSAETWHKQGRAPKPGEQPLKRVPFRAATTNRRREIAEAELATGGKVLQGLFSMEQTEWIIPDPIVDGIIPKNEYGNIDLFAEHMCPAGAVHVPYRGAVRVCKRLGVDYAEAVVDFEFGHRMAVPVIQGVVCAEEHFERVMEELQKDEVERKRKEDEKRRAEVMKMWRKFVMGLRIVQRLNGVYGDVEAQEKTGQGEDMAGGFLVGDENEENGDVGGGGFIPEGYELEEEEEENVGKATDLTSGFFPTMALSDEEEDGDEDALMIENGDDHTTIGAAAREEQSRLDEEVEEADLEPEPEPEKTGKGKGTKKSAMSTRPKRQSAATISKKKKSSTKAALGGLRRSRRRVASSSEEDDADEDEIGDSEADDDDDVYMDSS